MVTPRQQGLSITATQTTVGVIHMARLEIYSNFFRNSTGNHLQLLGFLSPSHVDVCIVLQVFRL